MTETGRTYQYEVLERPTVEEAAKGELSKIVLEGQQVFANDATAELWVKRNIPKECSDRLEVRVQTWFRG